MAGAPAPQPVSQSLQVLLQPHALVPVALASLAQRLKQELARKMGMSPGSTCRNFTDRANGYYWGFHTLIGSDVYQWALILYPLVAGPSASYGVGLWVSGYMGTNNAASPASTTSTQIGGHTITRQLSNHKRARFQPMRPSRPALAFALLGLSLGVLAAGQAPRTLRTQLDGILAQASSGGLDQRMAAFDRLVAFRDAQGATHPELIPAIHGGFVALLRWENGNEGQENARFLKRLERAGPGREASVGPEGDPAEGDFLGNLIQVVAATRDPRSLPVLLDDIETGAGATGAIAQFGEPVVPLLLARLESESPGSVVCLDPVPAACVAELHQGAFIALMRMTKPDIRSSLSASTVSRLQGLITLTLSEQRGLDTISAIQAARSWREPAFEPLLVAIAEHSTNWALRMSAVIPLAGYPNPGIRRLIAQIATHDSQREVRDAARAALQQRGGGR
ncbi:MAG TPA: HEAT repeat domain-containing protein [Terriglobales bacterium]|nr:HEAT repeat domain-containing protein [Terriglobales bacterium]